MHPMPLGESGGSKRKEAPNEGSRVYGRRWDALRALGAASLSLFFFCARDRDPQGPRRRLGAQPRARSAQPMRQRSFYNIKLARSFSANVLRDNFEKLIAIDGVKSVDHFIGHI